MAAMVVLIVAATCAVLAAVAALGPEHATALPSVVALVTSLSAVALQLRTPPEKRG